MPLYPTWNEIALRLALTMLAAGVIGINRGVGGHEAGLRTTILVGLAASVAMIQANLLLPLAGKTSQSFAVMDLMRLPLGILTGVGFIGGGAILRRGDLVSGVTTAATLWLVTVIGLCLGGGQIALGVAATVLGFFTLWAMKTLEARTPRKRRANSHDRDRQGSARAGARRAGGDLRTADRAKPHAGSDDEVRLRDLLVRRRRRGPAAKRHGSLRQQRIGDFRSPGIRTSSVEISPVAPPGTKPETDRSRASWRSSRGMPP